MNQQILSAFVSTAVIASALRIATPIVTGAIGGCFTRKAGITFIGYECLILTSAFFSTWGSYISGSAVIGTLIGMASALVMGAIYGLLSFHLGANPLIVCIALNYGAWAITTSLLAVIFGVRGAIIDPKIISYKPISMGFLKFNNTVNVILNDKVILVYIAYILIAVASIVMYKTPFGLRLRGVGNNPTAAQSAGTSVIRYKWIALVIMSLLLGLAGAYLPLSGLSMFTENMSSGRGFLVMAAVLVGKGDPVKTGLIAMLFAYANAVALALSAMSIPGQLLEAAPYFAVLIVLIVTEAKEIISSKAS